MYNKIILHHSNSSYGDAKQIDFWHKLHRRGSIGFNFIVLNGCRTNQDLEKGIINPDDFGRIEKGRLLTIPPWPSPGYKDAITICLIHSIGMYYCKVLNEAEILVAALSYHFGIKDVFGHSEIDPNNLLCPGLSMKHFRENVNTLIAVAKSSEFDKYLVPLLDPKIKSWLF